MRSGSGRRRFCGLGTLVVSLCVLASAPAWAQLPAPNIIVINSDDYAWPYYGFMQRYLRAKQQAGEHGRSYAVDTRFESLQGRYRYGLLLPDDDDPSTPPLHKILTPALDSLAGGTHGQYFPIGHVGGSVCEPSMAATLTGLHLTDQARPGGDRSHPKSASPVIPEFLIGFQWDVGGAGVPQASGSMHYLTMAAGKWTYDPRTHVFDEPSACDHDHDGVADPCAECAPEHPCRFSEVHPITQKYLRKSPWDRELKTGSDSDGARRILRNPQLQDVKDFIACARCEDFVCVNNTNVSCTPPGGNECTPPGGPNAGPCWPRGCIDPRQDYRPDSGRIAAWVGKCLQNPSRIPKPFFIFYNPLMPHVDFEEWICPDFDRGFDANDGLKRGLCNESPYDSQSAYCKGSGVFADSLDPDLNRCQPSTGDPCCPGGGRGAGTCDDGTLPKCAGDPCTNDDACPAGQVCRPIDLSCNCFANLFEEIGNNIAASPDPDISAKNIYTPSPACPVAALDADRFENKGDYLRFINTFDRTVDEILVHLRDKQLDQNTLVLVLTDNGIGDVYMSAGKGYFTEHGFRSPFALYDPTSSPPAPAEGCAGEPGCRGEFVQFTDVLATIRDAQNTFLEAFGYDFGLDPAGLLPNPLPVPLRVARDPMAPDAYAEGQSLRPVGGASQIDRACRFPSDDALAEPPAGECSNYFEDPANKSEFKQCLFGMKNGDQGTLTSGRQSRVAKDGWYVLAEMKDSDGHTHLCKLYHHGAATDRLYDLACDPNERVDLTPAAAHYPAGHARLRRCVANGDIVGPACADRGDCGGGQCIEESCRGGVNDGAPCTTNANCGPQCQIVCVGGANEGTACTADSECPDGACGPDLAGSKRRCGADPLRTCTANSDCSAGDTCRLIPDEYCKRQFRTLKQLLYYTAAKRQWLRTGDATSSDWRDHPYDATDCSP